MNRLSILALVAPAVLALTGCMRPVDSDEEEIATASAASALQSTKNAGSSNSSVVEAIQQAHEIQTCVTPEGVAAACAAEPNVGIYPSTCAVKTADGPSLHVEYSDCTGPFGNVHVTGGADVALAPGKTCDEVDAVMSDSGDLTANLTPLSYDATATIKVLGDVADVTWLASWSAPTWAGEATVDDDLSLRQDLTNFCVTADGTGRASIANWDLTSTLKGYTVCPDACPAAGHLEVSATNGSWEGTISIDFDGSDTAHAIGTQGQAFDVSLVCAP